MGERFHEEAGMGEFAPFSRIDCASMLLNLIESDGGILLVAEANGALIGMAGGLVYPFYFNTAHITGQEVFWWVHPDHRKGPGRALLEALEAEAKARGCESWSMVALASVAPEAVGRLYRRRGYRPSEQSYIKRL